MTLEGKKIYFFAGRIHHYKKLKSVFDAVFAQGADVKWILSENALNIDPACEFIIPSRDPFIHALDFLGQPDSAVVTSQTHGILRNVIRATTQPADIWIDTPTFWIAYSIREALEFTIAVQHLIESENPDCFVLLHEANFWTKILAYLGHAYGVKVVSCQEGLLRLRDQATLGKFNLSGEYSDRILMWSEQAKAHYVQAGVPESKIAVVGQPHLDHWLAIRQNKEQWMYHRAAVCNAIGFNPGLPVISFCLPLLSRYEGSAKSAIGQLCNWSADNFMQVAIRFHPFEHQFNIETVKKAIAEHPYAKVVEIETLDLILASDLVLSQHSTVAVETLALDIQLAEIDLDNAGVLESLADQGVAYSLRDKGFEKIISIVKGETKPDLNKLVEWARENVGELDGKSTERFVGELERLLA